MRLADCDRPYPDTSNQCNVSRGETGTQMTNFCTSLLNNGDAKRREFCGLMSNAGEWGTPVTIHDTCSYNNCNFYQSIGFGCCGSACCGIVGGGLACTRLSFAGDPITCCFNDLNNSGLDPNLNPDLCFSDNDKQRTCSDGNNGTPNYRDLTSSDCKDQLIQYCTGTLPTDEVNSLDWINRWTVGGPQSCSYALRRNLFPETGTEIPTFIPGICNIPPIADIDSEGYFWGQQLIRKVFNKYQEQGFQIGTLPGNPGYNPFQEYLYTNVCCPYPGLCQDALESVCRTTSSQRLSLNPALAQWCGCHLPDGEYQDYSIKYNIPPQCTPMCNRIGAVPIVGINSIPVVCEQDICLIDDVSVNLIESQAGGGINFNQICGNCSGNCSCIISDTSVDIIGSTIGGDINIIDQNCGNLTCTQTNPSTTGPSTITVDCSEDYYNPYDQYDQAVEQAQHQARKRSFLWTVLIVLLGLALIYFIIAIIIPNIYPPEPLHNIVKENGMSGVTGPTSIVSLNTKAEYDVSDMSGIEGSSSMMPLTSLGTGVGYNDDFRSINAVSKMSQEFRSIN